MFYEPTALRVRSVLLCLTKESRIQCFMRILLIFFFFLSDLIPCKLFSVDSVKP